MGGFDFRKDGANVPEGADVPDGDIPHWLMTRSRPGTIGMDGDHLANQLSNVLVINAVANGHCPSAVLALMVREVCSKAEGQPDDNWQAIQSHTLAEIRSVIDAIERGEC